MGKDDAEGSSTESQSEGEKSSVAVVVSDEKLGRFALKWAIDHLPFKGQAITLIGMNTSSSKLTGFDDTRNTPEPDEKQDELSPTLRSLCESRNLTWELVTLQVQDNDAAKALVKYVLKHRIERLVLGSSSKKANMSRLFQKHDTTNLVLRGAPDFCTVYVISKGRVTAMRPAIRPFRPLGEEDKTLHSIGSSIGSRNSVSGIPRYKKPDNRCYDEHPPRHADVPLGSTGRLSTDSMFLALCDMGSHGTNTHRVGKSSSVTNISNFDPLMPSDAKLPYMSHSADELSSGDEESRVKARPPMLGLDDMEEKMRKLEMEMSQTMEMYHAACKQAFKEQQKTRELQMLRKRDEQRAKEARMAMEEAQAIVEEEKAKCREAMKEAERAAQDKRDVLCDPNNQMCSHQNLVHILVVIYVLYIYFNFP